MKSGITCLHCCETLDIPKWVNTENYDGEIYCKKCRARLSIKFKGSEKPVRYKLIEKPMSRPVNITRVEYHSPREATNED